MNLPEVLDGTTMTPIRVLHPSSVAAYLSILSVSTADIKVLIHEKVELGDWVRVYYPNGKSGVFRAGNPVYDYDKDTMTVTTNHGCVTLADSVVTEGYAKDKDGDYKEVYFEGSVSTVLSRLLGYQKTKHWKLGTVEPTDEIKIEIKYQDILTLINDVMEQVEDGYIEYDQRKYPWTINIRKKPTEVTSEGRLSRNVRSAKVSYDDTELITKLYCNELDAPLTSKNVNKYGLREGFYYVSSDDKSWVAKACDRYLKNREKPIVSINIDGADFSQITGVAIDKVILADLYRLAIPKYKTVVEEQITEVTYDDLINRPNECSITLGSHKNDLSSVMAKTASTASHASTTASYVGAKEKTHWDNFIGEVDGLNTQITQLKDLIKLQANDVENRLHAELTITASQIQSALRSGWTGYESLITQTAEQIRLEVNNKFFGLGSSITQTATMIMSEVHDTRDGLQSQITQTAGKISLKVSKGDVATELSVEMGNVSIKNGNLVVDGMVTADAVSAAVGKIDHLQVPGTITAYTIKIKAGGTEKNVWSAIENLEYEKTEGNTVYLKYTKFNGITGEVTFSKAALLSGSWSSGTYTVAPDANGASTTAATKLSATPYEATWMPLMKTYGVKIGYIKNGVLSDTGQLMIVDAMEAYVAGQDSVVIPHPTYTGSWANSTYTAYADATAVKSTTLNGCTITNTTYQPTPKTLLVALAIGSTNGDTGYAPAVTVDATDAYNAGWLAYHNSNLFEIQADSTSSVKKVYRPGSTPGAAHETWFKVKLDTAWETASKNATTSNKLTYKAQRKIGSGSWGDMVVDDLTITLSQDGNTVYAKSGSKNICKIPVSSTTNISDMSISSITAAGQLAAGTSAKANITVSLKVDGKPFSQMLKTGNSFSLAKGAFGAYYILKYGSTAIAWLKV